ncbi:hypothetical protein CDAR_215751 [Caerostris darwini]|uniref:Uncharacterized protein n=1 Tax=Caerostris darwini TaxID=1538125 RepID=A0AAV4SEP5_9ARAC|nr:hypothetical protein CDAR_215751 [Caerostris darwini]
MHLERYEAVSRFRLTTDHNYLQAHLHRIGLISDGIIPLSRIANKDGEHLCSCIELIVVPYGITTRYWETRRRMAKTTDGIMTPFSKSAITDRVVLSISTSVERSRTFWQHSPLSPDFLSDSSGSLLP